MKVCRGKTFFFLLVSCGFICLSSTVLLCSVLIYTQVCVLKFSLCYSSTSVCLHICQYKVFCDPNIALPCSPHKQFIGTLVVWTKIMLKCITFILSVRRISGLIFNFKSLCHSVTVFCPLNSSDFYVIGFWRRFADGIMTLGYFNNGHSWLWQNVIFYFMLCCPKVPISDLLFLKNSNLFCYGGQSCNTFNRQNMLKFL